MRAVALAFLILLAAAPASAAASINVSPTSVPAGGSVTVSGSVAGGCSPGSEVTLISKAFSSAQEFAGVPAITTPSQSNGQYSTSAQIASGTAPGSYSISGRCGGGNIGATTLHVTAASGALPRTGFDAWAVAALGVGMMAGGAALRSITPRHAP